jgi:hypothetical protein
MWCKKLKGNELIIYSLLQLTAAHPSPPNNTSVKVWPCGVDVQMGLNG